MNDPPMTLHYYHSFLHNLILTPLPPLPLQQKGRNQTRTDCFQKGKQPSSRPRGIINIIRERRMRFMKAVMRVVVMVAAMLATTIHAEDATLVEVSEG